MAIEKRNSKLQYKPDSISLSVPLELALHEAAAFIKRVSKVPISKTNKNGHHLAQDVCSSGDCTGTLCAMTGSMPILIQEDDSKKLERCHFIV
jgi:hypothetical protein